MGLLLERAAAAGREYITPEDIVDGVQAGMVGSAIAREVLEAIANDKVEDVKLCAFAAHRQLTEGGRA